MRCLHCGEQTSFFSNVEPDEDWEYSLALLKGSVGEADEAAAALPAEDDPFWWRAEELYKAGFPYEVALEVAALPVDLHEACDLVGKAGSELAFQILS